MLTTYPDLKRIPLICPEVSQNSNEVLSGITIEVIEQTTRLLMQLFITPSKNIHEIRLHSS
jgi:hypothetical protein